MIRRTIQCAAILLLTISLQSASADMPRADGAMSVKVTGPGMNEILNEGATMTIIAEAGAAQGQIAKVELYNNDQLIGAATAAPYKLQYGNGRLAAGNYRLHAKVYDEQGRSAISPAVTVTVKRRVQWTARSYDYEETNEGMLKQVRLTVPDGLPVVRGILVITNGSSGDTREFWKLNCFREFLYMHGFAFFGTKAFNSHADTLIVFRNAIAQFAKESGHPEIESAPFVAFGGSAGGGFANTLLGDVPHRVIACAPVSAGNVKFEDNAAVRATPICLMSGEQETRLNGLIQSVMEASRTKGSLISWIPVQGLGHTGDGQQVLAVPFFDQAIRLRYPADQDPRKGPVQLLPVDPKTGWIADHATWRCGLTAIMPYAEFKGPVGASSWLLSKDIAWIYRAYATYDNPLKITSLPPPTRPTPILDPGANVTLVVDDTAFPDWQSMEFFAGAQKLGEVRARPAQLVLSDLKTGVYVFTVLATDAKGVARTSSPVLAIVRRLPQ